MTRPSLPYRLFARMAFSIFDVQRFPCAVWGVHRFHTTGQPLRWSWRLPVSVRYGPPLHPTPDSDPAVGTRELTDAETQTGKRA
jgi:hypothetical protein